MSPEFSTRMTPTCILDLGASHANCVRSVALARSIIGCRWGGALPRNSDRTRICFVGFVIANTLHGVAHLTLHPDDPVHQGPRTR